MMIVAFKTSKSDNTNFSTPQEMFQDNKMKSIMGLIDYQSKTLDNYMNTIQSNGAIVNKYVAFELPTGSGKTLIGLLIAEFHRRKFHRKALFLCPTNQLVSQVCYQAKKQYGIDTVAFSGKQSDYSVNDRSAYILGQKIGVTTYSSFFAISEYFEDPDILIFDDVHSSENYIADGWSLDIQRKYYEPLYLELAECLRDALGDSGYSRMLAPDPYVGDVSNWCNLLPHPMIESKIQDIYDIINSNVQDTALRYSWSRISDHLSECNIFVSWDSILIRPYIAPTESFTPFKRAKQSVFMSATLGKSGELERVTGVNNIKLLPMVSDWDKKGLGRKFFVFPDLSFEEKYHNDFILKLHKIAKRSVVIVPSLRDQEDIIKIIEKNSPTTRTFSAEDLIASREEFLKCEDAMAVIANRFDGIDFPDDESRMLIVYNLPKVTHLQEKFLYSRMAASILFSERVKTRIVQAVGRCTRNASDFAVVCILGHTVLNELVSDKNLKSYRPEMRAEIQFGVVNSTDLTDVAELFNNIELFLKRDLQWQEAEDEIVRLRDKYVAEGDDEQQLLIFEKLHKSAIKEVELQYCLWKKDYQKAFEIIQQIISELDAPALSGYKCFWQYLGGSIGRKLGSPYNQKSIQLFQEAAKGNLGVTWLSQLAKISSDTDGLEAESKDYFCDTVDRIEEQLGAFKSGKRFESKIAEIINGLTVESGIKFEYYHVELGRMLGYYAGNSKEGSAPDPYWVINDDICIVFEDKIYENNSKKIPTTDVTQAKRHEAWIRSNIKTLRKDAVVYTVMITNSESIEDDAKIHATGIFYCNRRDFVIWANTALNCLRTCKSLFCETGDAEWRLEAQKVFRQSSVTPLDFVKFITQKPLDKLLK